MGSEYQIAELDMKDKNAKMKLLTKVSGDWESPSWLADGRHIICSRKHNGKQSLYMIDSWYGRARELKAQGWKG